jgi:anti-sigma B factor antagonist
MSATAPEAFEVRDLVSGGRHVLILSGDLDLAAAGDLAAVLARVSAQRPAALTIDLSGLRFMDSSGLHAIIDARTRCADRGVQFALIPGPRRVQRVFEIIGVAEELPFEPPGRPRGPRLPID